jgi:glycerol kinase
MDDGTTMGSFILAIDQGTTSSRALVFAPDFSVVGLAQQEFLQHFPASGYVEHEPEDIWSTTLATAREALARAGLNATQIAAIGIANQRETCVVWDRRSGTAIHRAIVWQDRRTADACSRLKSDGAAPLVAARTGLVLDPYFSGTKVAWILDTVPGARTLAEQGHLAFGTIDTYLLWRLTGGRVHATDATNASRTMLFDIGKGRWDDDLLRLLNVPRSILPDVRDSAADYGTTAPEWFGCAIAVRSVIGDQQAATIGQACFKPGMMKSTYGTGCFALLNTGREMVASENRLLTTIAYQLRGERTYALEGSIFVAGAAVQWLRDGLKMIAQSGDAGRLSAMADPAQQVLLVPAFVGLGAPHWNPDVRGALFGITRNTGPAEFARAALMSVAFQTRDLLEAMTGDWPGAEETILRVDGGMVASDWTLQFLADILDAPVDRPTILETTALGAAWLAGHAAGVWPDQDGFSRHWKCDRRFEAHMGADERATRMAAWTRAVAATLAFSAP